MYKAWPRISALALVTAGQCAVLTATAASTAASSPTVTLDYATYEGIRQEDGVDVYLGMRYAAPPTGDLRFKAPQDPVVEMGTTEAKAVSIPFLQKTHKYILHKRLTRAFSMGLSVLELIKLFRLVGMRIVYTSTSSHRPMPRTSPNCLFGSISRAAVTPLIPMLIITAPRSY